MAMPSGWRRLALHLAPIAGSGREPVAADRMFRNRIVRNCPCAGLSVHLPGEVCVSLLASPLTPFVDALPLPARVLASEHGGELTVHIRAAAHRFHRDLPESPVWA